MRENPTPIEIVADALGSDIGDVLVPEQCMIVYIDEVAYHLTLEPIENQGEQA